MLRDVLKDEWGFDGVVMSDWYAGRSTEAAGSAALDLVDAGPDRPVGRRAGRGRARRARERGGDRRQGAAAAAARGARRRARRRRAGHAGGAPWPDERGRRRAARDRGGRLRARAQRGRAAAARRADAAPRRGDRAQRRRRRARSAAAARPSSRRTRSRRSRACAPRSGRTSRSTTRPACAAHTRIAAAPRRELLAAPVEVRFLAADGAVLGSERRRARRLHLAGLLRRGRADRARSRPSRSTRACAPPAPASTSIGCSGLGRFRARRSTASVAFDERARAAAGRRPGRGHHAPAAARRPGRARRRARRSTLVLRHEPPPATDVVRRSPARPSSSTSSRRARSDDEELDARGRAGRARPTSRWSWSAPPRRSRARASTATRSRCPAARTSSSGASRRPTRARSSSSTPARRCCCRGPTRSRPCCSTWFPGQEFGNALADVLLGDAEPGGRLPTTWPRVDDGLPSTQPVDGVARLRRGAASSATAPTTATGATPLYPFGHGLGYTTWEYLDLASDGRGRCR